MYNMPNEVLLSDTNNIQVGGIFNFKIIYVRI